MEIQQPGRRDETLHSLNKSSIFFFILIFEENEW